MNLDKFDGSARKVYVPATRSSDTIQTGLNNIQQRSKERQAKLNADDEAETALINSLTKGL